MVFPVSVALGVVRRHLRSVRFGRVVAVFRMRAKTVICLGVGLRSPTLAQVPWNHPKSLNHEQCENTQHGEDSGYGGNTEHALQGVTGTSFVQEKWSKAHVRGVF